MVETVEWEQIREDQPAALALRETGACWRPKGLTRCHASQLRGYSDWTKHCILARRGMRS